MDKNGQDKCLDVWKPKTGLSQVYPTAEFKDKHLRSHATRISPVFPHSIPIKWLVQISIKSYWQFFLLQFWKSIPFERTPNSIFTEFWVQRKLRKLPMWKNCALQRESKKRCKLSKISFSLSGCGWEPFSSASNRSHGWPFWHTSKSVQQPLWNNVQNLQLKLCNTLMQLCLTWFPKALTYAHCWLQISSLWMSCLMHVDPLDTWTKVQILLLTRK